MLLGSYGSCRVRRKHSNDSSTILLPSFLCLVVGYRLLLAEAQLIDALDRHIRLDDQITQHRVQPLLAELDVVIRVADGIGPSFKNDHRVRILFDLLCKAIENRVELRLELRTV